MLKNILAVLAGVVTAFVIMLLFEYVNSFFFPLPAGLDINNVEAVHSFTRSLPWTAYVLVIAGWVGGSFFAGFVVEKYNREAGWGVPVIVGVLLTVLGILNFQMIGHPVWVVVIGLLIFFPMTLAGYKASGMGGK